MIFFAISVFLLIGALIAMKTHVFHTTSKPVNPTSVEPQKEVSVTKYEPSENGISPAASTANVSIPSNLDEMIATEKPGVVHMQYGEDSSSLNEIYQSPAFKAYFEIASEEKAAETQQMWKIFHNEIPLFTDEMLQYYSMDEIVHYTKLDFSKFVAKNDTHRYLVMQGILAVLDCHKASMINAGLQPNVFLAAIIAAEDSEVAHINEPNIALENGKFDYGEQVWVYTFVAVLANIMQDTFEEVSTKAEADKLEKAYYARQREFFSANPLFPNSENNDIVDYALENAIHFS